jgi:hypothetical protein
MAMMKKAGRQIRMICLAVALGIMAAPAARADGTAIIDNKSSFDVWDLWISSSGQDSWGPDQLGTFQIIGTGRYRSFSIPWSGCLVDLMVKLSNGQTLRSYRFNACLANATWTIFDE